MRAAGKEAGVMAKHGLTAGLGQRTKKGTLVTEKVQSAAKADIEGIKVIQDNTDKVLAALPLAMARALEKIGLAAEGYAKRLCPVDTGRLRNSVTHAIDGGEKSVYVGTNVEYAPHVELGTSRQKAQPFLVPAVSEHADEYRSIAKGELGG